MPSFKDAGHNLWKIVDHATSKDIQVSNSKSLWSLNRFSNEYYNNDVHKLEQTLKNILFKVLDESYSTICYDVMVS